jgi:hypothetical protein
LNEINAALADKRIPPPVLVLEDLPNATCWLFDTLQNVSKSRDIFGNNQLRLLRQGRLVQAELRTLAGYYSGPIGNVAFGAGILSAGCPGCAVTLVTLGRVLLRLCNMSEEQLSQMGELSRLENFLHRAKRDTLAHDLVVGGIALSSAVDALARQSVRFETATVERLDNGAVRVTQEILNYLNPFHEALTAVAMAIGVALDRNFVLIAKDAPQIASDRSGRLIDLENNLIALRDWFVGRGPIVITSDDVLTSLIPSLERCGLEQTTLGKMVRTYPVDTDLRLPDGRIQTVPSGRTVIVAVEMIDDLLNGLRAFMGTAVGKMDVVTRQQQASETAVQNLRDRMAEIRRRNEPQVTAGIVASRAARYGGGGTTPPCPACAGARNTGEGVGLLAIAEYGFRQNAVTAVPAVEPSTTGATEGAVPAAVDFSDWTIDLKVGIKTSLADTSLKKLTDKTGKFVQQHTDETRTWAARWKDNLLNDGQTAATPKKPNKQLSPWFSGLETDGLIN